MSLPTDDAPMMKLGLCLLAKPLGPAAAADTAMAVSSGPLLPLFAPSGGVRSTGRTGASFLSTYRAYGRGATQARRGAAPRMTRFDRPFRMWSCCIAAQTREDS